MGKIIFIIGGARSGKSRFCVELAKRMGKRVLFIATSIPQDQEMKKRVALHKKSRPRFWKTIEEDKKITSVLNKWKNKFDVVILDCLGLFISNLLSQGLGEKAIQREIKSIARTFLTIRSTAIIVSNEVGAGIVPNNSLARRFRDLVGLSNQIVARYAHTVYIIQAGIPIKIERGR